MQDNRFSNANGIANRVASITEYSTERLKLWRPWAVTKEVMRNERRPHNSPYSRPEGNVSFMKQTELVHPAKLFWPRSKCYDYLYQEAEALLKNYPVQATISFYDEDSSCDSDNDSDEEDSLN